MLPPRPATAIYLQVRDGPLHRPRRGVRVRAVQGAHASGQLRRGFRVRQEDLLAQDRLGEGRQGSEGEFSLLTSV